MQLSENKWRCRIDSKLYLKAIMLVVLLATFTATLLILFVRTNKEPVGDVYTDHGKNIDKLILCLIQCLN